MFGPDVQFAGRSFPLILKSSQLRKTSLRAPMPKPTRAKTTRAAMIAKRFLRGRSSKSGLTADTNTHARKGSVTSVKTNVKE